MPRAYQLKSPDGSPAPAAKDALLTPLVAAGLRLRAQRDELLNQLAVVEAELIALGAGRYRDEENHTCLVIAATAESLGPDSYFLKSQDEDDARTLALDSFPKVFDRHIRYTPCEGFANVVPKLFTPAKARDLLALCFVPGKTTPGKRAYLRWA